MERIHSQREGFRQLAQRVLTWITCATRPLSATELQHALAVELGERSLDRDNIPSIGQLASVCSGLVTVDRESNVVRLIHYTTQEYFNRTRGLWFPSAEEELCTICVTYLSFDAFSSGFSESYTQYKERLKPYPLYEYSARSWATHVHNTSCHSSSALSIETSKPILDFLEGEPPTLRQPCKSFPWTLEILSGLLQARHRGRQRVYILLRAKLSTTRS
ncbi:hypothetical protein VTI74DRAFT_6502 [Chaetomium olivicolor]